MMLLRLSAAMACSVLAVTLMQPGFGQTKEKTAKAPAAGTTVTGCLAKGDEAREYTIKGDDGQTYELRSSKINLAEHVGHKVTVTGSMMREKEKHEKASTATPEGPHLRVTNLTMVSTTCP